MAMGPVGSTPVSIPSLYPASSGNGSPTTTPAPTAPPQGSASSPTPLQTQSPSSTGTPSSASPQDVQKAAANVQSHLAKMATELSFTIDQSTGKTVINVTDPGTGQVIQQIPSKQILELDQAINNELSKVRGVLIDQHG